MRQTIFLIIALVAMPLAMNAAGKGKAKQKTDR